jgi:hypothetical protein
MEDSRVKNAPPPESDATYRFATRRSSRSVRYRYCMYRMHTTIPLMRRNATEKNPMKTLNPSVCEPVCRVSDEGEHGR